MKELKCLNKVELFVLNWTGKVLMVIGILGMLLTIGFDRIARDMPIELGWLQTLGIIVSAGIAIYGYITDIWLSQVKVIIRDYLIR